MTEQKGSLLQIR